MMSNLTKTLMRGLVLLAALTACGLLVGGCESDSVAPQDELPALTKDGAATQAAIVATALASVAPEFVRYDGPTKDDYSYNFVGVEGITGTVNLQYWTGGIDGDPATFDVGDYARLWTPEPAGLVLETETGGSISVVFDITAQVVQATDTATIMIGSNGTFTSGDYVTSFNILNLVVTDSDYPTSGSVEVSAGGFDMIVTFDGDHTAMLTIDGEGTWLVDLNDGTLLPIPVK